MWRRKFIKLIGAAALLAFAAQAQQRSVPIIGFINSESSKTYSPFVEAFRQGLRQTGYVEGHNVAIQYRWGENDATKTADFLAERSDFPST